MVTQKLENRNYTERRGARSAREELTFQRFQLNEMVRVSGQEPEEYSM